MKLTKDEQMKVYAYFFGMEFSLAEAYISPIPEDVRGSADTSSSFNVYENRKGNVVWKDFGGGGISGGAIDLIMVMRSLSYGKACDFYRQRIKNNRNLNSETLRQSNLSRSSGKRKNLQPRLTTVNPHEWMSWEWSYWEDLEIDVNYLYNEKRTSVLRGIDWGNGRLVHKSRKDDPIFVYDLSEEGDLSSWKAYRPFAKKFGEKELKWKTWNLGAVPSDAHYLLPRSGNNLVYTSSRKDGYVLENVEIGNRRLDVSVDNPVAEGSWRKILSVLPEQKKDWNFIYVLFDNDHAGLKASEDFAEEGGIINLTKHFPFPDADTKDLTLVVENYSYSRLDKAFLECITKAGVLQNFIPKDTHHGRR